VGREVRDALADFRVTGARLLPVLVPAGPGWTTDTFTNHGPAARTRRGACP